MRRGGSHKNKRGGHLRRGGTTPHVSPRISIECQPCVDEIQEVEDQNRSVEREQESTTVKKAPGDDPLAAAVHDQIEVDDAGSDDEGEDMEDNQEEERGQQQRQQWAYGDCLMLSMEEANQIDNAREGQQQGPITAADNEGDEASDCMEDDTANSGGDEASDCMEDDDLSGDRHDSFTDNNEGPPVLPSLPFFHQDRASHGFQISTTCCNNCRRQPYRVPGIDTDEHPYYIVCLRSSRNKVFVAKEAMRRKFSNLKWVDVQNAMRSNGGSARAKSNKKAAHGATLTLCTHCQKYFTEAASNEMGIVWPAMIWKWLSNESLIERHGQNLWSLVPRLWRPWWIVELQKFDPLVYGGITLDNPRPAFTDVTIQKMDFQDSIESKKAGELVEACDTHLYPVLKCPWGCTEYYHMCGQQCLDGVVSNIYGSNVITVATPSQRKKGGNNLVGMRQDYLDPTTFDDLLHNGMWPIRPSIAFTGHCKYKSPMVLSCRDHTKGSKGRYLHPPRSPVGVLPSKIQDQLTPAVVRTNSLKPLKAHKFSHTFQMHEMRGEYNGVDTLRVSEHHDFSVDSKIMAKNQSLSIKGRKDIELLVREWGEDGNILPPRVADDFMEVSNSDFPNPGDLEDYCHGATFVTLQDALKLQVMNKNDQGRVITFADQLEGGSTLRSRHYVPSWPKTIINVHPYDSYGCSFPLVPNLKYPDTDVRLAWYLLAMHTMIPAIWEASDGTVHLSTDWSGWLLSYITKECYPERRNNPRANSIKQPFTIQRGRSVVHSVYELLIRLGMKEAADDSEESNESSQVDRHVQEDDNDQDDKDGDDDDDNDNDDDHDDRDAEAEDDGHHVDHDDDNDDDNESSDDEMEFHNDYDDDIYSPCQFQLDDPEQRQAAVPAPTTNQGAANENESDNESESERESQAQMDSQSIRERDSESGSETSSDTTQCTVDGTRIHTDGSYHPEDLHVYFNNHPNISVMPYTPGGSSLQQLLSPITPNATAVIFYRQSEDGVASDEESEGSAALDEPLPNRVEDQYHAHWELRLLSSTGGYGVKQTNDRDLYCRHGGGSFPGWWHQHVPSSANQQTVQEKVSGDIPDIAYQAWDIAVYVKEKTMELQQCRDTFLETLGTQTSMHCKEHKMPLIVSPFHCSKSCCCRSEQDETKQCPRKVGFLCPVSGCGAAVCIGHHKRLSHGVGSDPYLVDPKSFVPVCQPIQQAAVSLHPGDTTNTNPSAPGHSSLGSVDTLDAEHGRGSRIDTLHHDDGADNIFSPLDVVEDVVDDYADGDYEVHGNDIDGAQVGFDSDSSVASVASSLLLLDSFPLAEASPYVALDPDNEDMLGFMNTPVPMTSNIDEPLKIHGDPTCMSGCTILNNMGTLLARKNQKLKGSKNQQFLLQKIVSTTPGRSVPLLYPEAMLFPSIFWKDAGSDGSIIGSIPSGLLAHDATLRKHGIASIQEHVRARIKNTSLRTSTDVGYLCYAFDNIVNLGCRHEDTRVILHRGIVGCPDGIRISGNDKQLFDTDSTDSRATVNKLAAAVAEKQATYFYTHTANQQMHFGLRKIKEWIDGDEVMEILLPNDDATERDRHEVRQALLQQASIIMLRNWMEVSLLYMNYVTYSEEKPLGDIEHIWWRYEFQDSVGNLPHIHALIWLRQGSATAKETQDKIRGSLMDIIQWNEIDDLVAEGLLSSMDDAWTVQELAQQVLTHVCSSRCKRRVGTKDGELRCRATNNALESTDPSRHTIETINVNHTEQALDILEEIGLFTLNEQTGVREPTVESLRATKHYPPASRSDGVLSACNGRLFTMTRSNNNLKIVTGYLASRYLAKYLALVDENNRVYIGAMSKERNAVKLDMTTLHNTKITGSKIQEEKRADKRRDKRHPTGRAISHMEILCILLGYNQVHTTLKFVHIPTCPFEERPAFDRKTPFRKLQEQGVVQSDQQANKPEDLDPAGVIPTYLIRNVVLARDMPLWRKIGAMESVTLRDQCLSPHTLDAITIFSIRPPELRFVRSPGYYFRWFYRDGKRPSFSFTKAYKQAEDCIKADTDLVKSTWVDGSDCRVYVRAAAIPEILHYLEHGGPSGSRRPERSFYPTELDDTLIPAMGENAWGTTHALFTLLNKREPRRNTWMHEQWQTHQARFIGKANHHDNKQLPVIWYNSIKPTQAGRWLIHLLLSMGEFDCEMNLFGCATMLECFQRATLIGDDPTAFDSDIETLARRYVETQLVYVPGGGHQFDRHVVAAWHTLKRTLLDGELPLNEMPAALYTQTVHTTDKKIRKFIDQTRKTLINVTYDELKRVDMVENLPPTADDFINATREDPYLWDIKLKQGQTQTAASFDEQADLLKRIEHQLDKYESADTQQQTKNLGIVGGPGVGKTTVMLLGVLLCASYGLLAVLTSMMCERSKSLGGRHIAILFSIPVNEKASPLRLAEMAIASLLRQPDRLALLQSLDVLFLDEMGQVSSELISIMDIILRRVRNSTAFMGGVLLITTMDEMQLHPIKGRPPLLSPHMLTSFLFSRLVYSVRASDDVDLQAVMEISRERPENLLKEGNTQIETFGTLLKEKCTWVPDWKDSRVADASILRMFGKKAAVRKAQDDVMKAMERKYGPAMLFSKACDSESTLEGNWIPATAQTSKELSRKIKLPAKLAFYPNAVYEMTYNKEGRFSQGQLAVLATMPTQDDIKEMRPVSVYVAPDGMKSLPSDLIQSPTEENFLHYHFSKQMIGTAPERAEQLGMGLQGKRQQYGLRHRIASTIHAGIGQTLYCVISQVSREDDMYKLWEKEQVVVLLSRTRNLESIIFVGDKTDTVDALTEVILKKSQYSEYMSYILDHLTSNSNVPFTVDLQKKHPWRPVDIPIPTDNSGYAYILVSLANNDITYIGETTNLAARYNKHACGQGASTTANPIHRPWGLLAYVTGFEGCNRGARQSFERLWQSERDRRNAQTPSKHLTPNEIADIAKSLIETKTYAQTASLSDKTLVFVRCGYIH